MHAHSHTSHRTPNTLYFWKSLYLCMCAWLWAVIFKQRIIHCYLDVSNQVEMTMYIPTAINIETLTLTRTLFASCKFFIFFGGPLVLLLVGYLHNHFSINSFSYDTYYERTNYTRQALKTEMYFSFIRYLLKLQLFRYLIHAYKVLCGYINMRKIRNSIVRRLSLAKNV